MTDTISRIMQIRNGMTTDADAEAIIEREIAALQPHGRSSPVTSYAPEVFLFYRDGQLHHIHRDRTVFETWIEKSPWQYPPERCEIVRYVPDASQPATPTGGESVGCGTPGCTDPKCEYGKGDDAAEAMARSSAGIEHALAVEVDGCFQAAYAEGLSERLAEADQDIGTLADLIYRRLIPAHQAACVILADATLSSCGAESNRHSGAVGAEKGAEQSNPGGGHEVTEHDAQKPYEQKPSGMIPRPEGALADRLEPMQYATGIAFSYNEFRMVIDALRGVAQPSWQPIIERLCKPESGHTIHDVVANYRAIRRDALAISSTPRHRPFCSCKASQRDGQHMAWCPAVTSTEGK